MRLNNDDGKLSGRIGFPWQLLRQKRVAILENSMTAFKVGRWDAYKKIAPYCRWTEGTWETLGIAWNEIENTPRDIRKLQTALVNIYSIAGIEQ